MEVITLPHEIKLHVCEYTNLQELKILRQTSRSWASAGAQFLLLSTFNIRSSKDIQRLLAIGCNTDLSRHATNVIRCLAFQSQGWNPRYFRNIVCNRHELRRNYETRDFVPNEAELEALNELENVIRQKDIDAQEDKATEALVAALRVVPRVNSIEFLCGNIFTHRILRKTWEEYDLEAFSESQQLRNQLIRILTAAKDAGLPIENFRHERLMYNVSLSPTPEPHIISHICQTLRSLNLNTTGKGGAVAEEELKSLIFKSPHLESLTLTFEILGTKDLTFLEPLPEHVPEPAIPMNSLHTLAFSGVTISNSFFTYLAYHRNTLKRFSIHFADIPRWDTMTWRDFLERLRDEYGSTLEKFQLSGLVRERADGGECWMIYRLYDDYWESVERSDRNARAKELEDFVIRGGPWPLTAEDTILLS